MLILIPGRDVRCDEHDRGQAWYVTIRAGNDHFVSQLCDICLRDLLNRWRLVGGEEACKRLKHKRWMAT